jgi:hypothetical protein
MKKKITPCPCDGGALNEAVEVGGGGNHGGGVIWTGDFRAVRKFLAFS